MLIALLLLCVSLFTVPAKAALAAGETLAVGVKEAPPFVMKNDDGSWSGLAIEMWEMMVRDLGLCYAIQEMGLQELLSGLKTGDIDVGIGALTITPEREASFDFIHSLLHRGPGDRHSDE